MTCKVITDKKANGKLSNLALKEDEDLYIYYCCTKGLLNRIHGQDQVINSGRNIITHSRAKQQFLKDTIIKFILGMKNFNF